LQKSAPAMDESTIKAAQAGDAHAFEQIVDASYEQIYRLSLRWAGNVSDAEDLAQQVCIKLARVLGQFRFESAFSTWLYRIVLNSARDWARQQQRQRDRHVALDEVQSLADEDKPEAQSELHQVLRRVDQMGEGYKETLLLVFAEGLSHAEAAQVLGIKEGSVSWRIHEIRKRLAQEAQQAGD
jgi:RNA polymerase sigma-70 factor (ECF subfamily)